MRKVYLDLKQADSAAALHAALAEALGFPEYYGGNLDALYDCLTDIDEDVCVGIYGPARDSMRDQVPRFLRVFADAEEANGHLCVFTFADAPDPGPIRAVGDDEMMEDLIENEAEMMGLWNFTEGNDD